jgi:hypothetical protein
MPYRCSRDHGEPVQLQKSLLEADEFRQEGRGGWGHKTQTLPHQLPIGKV